MHFSFRKHLIFGGLVVIALFAVISGLYVDKKIKADLEHFSNHSVIIADEIWAVDRVGVETYLELTASLNNFKKLCVIEPGGQVFAEVTREPLTAFDELLLKLKLTSVYPMSQDIYYRGDQIAVLKGEKYIEFFPPLLNIFITVLLFAVTTIFLRYLFATRRFLQERLIERTQKLRESESRFEDLVNLLPEMVWETDIEGRITYINRVGYQSFGITREDNVLFTQLLDVESQAEAEVRFEETLIGQDTGLQEYNAKTKDGHIFPLLLRSSLRYLNGEVVGTRMLGVDISERLKLEEQLQRDRRMKALGLMAGGVAHDLNNILSGVVGYPDLLLLQLDKDSKLRSTVESIKKSGMQAAEVVSDLLTVVRGGVVQKETADISELVKEYSESNDFAELKKNHPKVNYELDISVLNSKIACSAMHIRKALMNLVINASEAIVGDGKVTISTRKEVVDDSIDCLNSVLEPGKYIRISVQDTGAGILEKDIDHIFEPFYSKKVMGKSGTGLGMALVWNAVMDHDGGIRLKTSGAGTLVDLFFPCDDNLIESNNDSLKISEDQPATDGYKRYISKGETVLVVDDEEQQRDLAEKVLTTLGYNVFCVKSGEEAVAFVQEKPVDILVLDMLMPPGMNGRQTYEQIVKVQPEQKAIIVSGYAETADLNSVSELGVAEIVHKPYSLEQIGKVMHTVLTGV